MWLSDQKLGDVMRRIGQTDAALKYHQDALAIAKKLAESDPRDAQGAARFVSFV